MHRIHHRFLRVLPAFLAVLGVEVLSANPRNPGFAPLMNLTQLVRQEMDAENHEQAEALIRLGLKSIESEPDNPFHFELNAHFSTLLFQKGLLGEAVRAAETTIGFYHGSGLEGSVVGEWFCLLAHQVRFKAMMVQGRLAEAEEDLASMRQLAGMYLEIGEFPPFPWVYPLFDFEADDQEAMEIMNWLFESHIQFHSGIGEWRSALKSLESQVDWYLGRESLSVRQEQYLIQLLSHLMTDYHVFGMRARAEITARMRAELAEKVGFPAEVQSLALLTTSSFSTALPMDSGREPGVMGTKSRELDETRKVYEKIQSEGTYADQQHAVVLLVTELIRHGETREALALIREKVPQFREEQLLIPAAILHSKALLAVGELGPEEAESYFLEGLRLVREAGALAYQFSLYERYARWLWSVNRYADALNVFYQYVDLIERWEHEHRQVLAAYRLAVWHLRLGDISSSEANQKKVNSSPLLIELGARINFSILTLQADFARATGDKAAYSAAFEAIQALFEAQGSAESQREYLQPTPFTEAFPFIEFDFPSLAQWNTLRVATTVQPGEVGRGRFDLVNTEPFSVTGTVSLESDQEFYGATVTRDAAILHWSTQDAAPGREAVGTLNVELGPLEMLTFYLEDFIEGEEEMPRTATLQWKADHVAEAKWVFSAEENAGRQHVVNANRIRYNPYFSLSYYHELYNREPTEKWLDFRIVSPLRLRIEYVDPDTQRLLAVDAQGDGDFRGPGDIVFADGNGSGTFDVVIPAGGVRALEFRLFTAEEEAIPDGEYPLSIQTRRMFGEWQEESRDMLIFRNEE